MSRATRRVDRHWTPQLLLHDTDTFQLSRPLSLSNFQPASSPYHFQCRKQQKGVTTNFQPSGSPYHFQCRYGKATEEYTTVARIMTMSTCHLFSTNFPPSNKPCHFRWRLRTPWSFCDGERHGPPAKSRQQSQLAVRGHPREPTTPPRGRLCRS